MGITIMENFICVLYLTTLVASSDIYYISAVVTQHIKSVVIKQLILYVV